MNDSTLYRLIDYLLDEVRDLKAEVTFYRAAGDDRQRLLNKGFIDQRAEGGFKNLSPEEIVAILKGNGQNDGRTNTGDNLPVSNQP